MYYPEELIEEVRQKSDIVDVISGYVGLQKKDPECDLDYTKGHGVHQAVNIAISNSLGFGGHNATVLVKKFEG